jgi:hypothetical protein
LKRSNRTRRPSTWNAWYWDVPLAALTLALAVWLLQANQPLFWAGHQLAAHGHATLWAYVTLCGDTLMVLTLCLPLVRVRPELIWAGVLAGSSTHSRSSGEPLIRSIASRSNSYS